MWHRMRGFEVIVNMVQFLVDDRIGNSKNHFLLSTKLVLINRRLVSSSTSFLVAEPDHDLSSALVGIGFDSFQR